MTPELWDLARMVKNKQLDDLFCDELLLRIFKKYTYREVVNRVRHNAPGQARDSSS